MAQLRVAAQNMIRFGKDLCARNIRGTNKTCRRSLATVETDRNDSAEKKNQDQTQLDPSSEAHIQDNDVARTDPAAYTKCLSYLTDYPLYATTKSEAENLLKPELWPFSSAIKEIVKNEPKIPSVSTILRDTMSEESRIALLKWKAKMIEKLGEEGFEKYQQELFDNGGNFHECVAQHLDEGTPIGDLPLFKQNTRLWDSVEPVFDHVSDVRYIETPVKHPMLGYMGIFDCVARYRSKLVIIDWKTSARPKFKLEHTYENPVQLVAYLAALNHDPAYDITVNGALLVIAYHSGKQAHVHPISPSVCKKYWSEWLERLNLYWTMKAQQQAARQASM